MTSQAPDPGLWQKRLDIVAAMTRINAQQLRNRQLLGGAEIEVAHLEEEAVDSGDAPRIALAEARARWEAFNAAIARHDDELAVLGEELAAIDRAIVGE